MIGCAKQPEQGVDMKKNTTTKAANGSNNGKKVTSSRRASFTVPTLSETEGRLVADCLQGRRSTQILI